MARVNGELTLRTTMTVDNADKTQIMQFINSATNTLIEMNGTVDVEIRVVPTRTADDMFN